MPYCCKGCGRDTESTSGYCIYCIGQPPRGNLRSREHLDRPAVSSKRLGSRPMDHEDDYGEESGPDSVCRDNHTSELRGRRFG